MRWLTFAALSALAMAQDPVIRVNTRLIQLNVLVHDKHGPVADLTKDDFTILDRGKQQRIALFNVNKAPTATTPIKSLPPGIFSNRLEARPDTPPSVTVLLLDTVNTEFTDQSYARSQAVKFLSAPRRGDRVALYLLSSRGVRVLHDFTEDASALVDALARYVGERSNALQASVEAAPLDTPRGGFGSGVIDTSAVVDILNAMTRANTAEMQDYYIAVRIRITAEAMLWIARHLRRVPGRKNVVWVSGSFPFALGADTLRIYIDVTAAQQRALQDVVRQTVLAISDADIAVYPVDARGLLAMPGWDPSHPAPPLNTRASPLRMQTQPISTTSGLDTMRELASATGGRAFYNTSDINGAIRKAIDDAAFTYTLGFYSQTGTLDGSFHELKVNVDRKGVDVRHRKGYFAVEEKPIADNERMALISNAASSALEATGVGLSASIEQVNQPGTSSIRVDLNVDMSNLTLEKKNDRWVGAAEITYARQAADGKILSLTSRTVSFNISETVYRAKLREGLLLSETIEPLAGLSQIRVLAVDQATGVVGSLTIPVTKP
jgi:VWFA-related protein